MLTSDETQIEIPGFLEAACRFTSASSGPINSEDISTHQLCKDKKSYKRFEGVIEELKTSNFDSAHFLDFHIINGASFNFGKKPRMDIQLSEEWMLRVEHCPHKQSDFGLPAEGSGNTNAQVVSAGRYNITHIGRISRLDGQAFDPDSRDVISILSTSHLTPPIFKDKGLERWSETKH